MQVLLTAKELRHGVARLAGEVSHQFAHQPLTIVGVLTGSIVLISDLIRQLDLPLRLGLVQANSYRGLSTTPGSLVINPDLVPDITGRHILLVDDIFDTGHTLVQVTEQLRGLEPASIRSLVLFRKEGRQEVDLEPDFVGFRIPNTFVVGYGLDYNDSYRNLPHLASLEPQDLANQPPSGTL